MGPFEEEEEGTCVASDVVKVQGEDLATPGPPSGYPRSSKLRNDPGTVRNSQYWFNKTKQHTLLKSRILDAWGLQALAAAGVAISGATEGALRACSLRRRRQCCHSGCFS